MNISKSYRNLSWKQWLVISLFCIVLAAIASSQGYFISIKNGLDPKWLSLFLNQIPIWSLWGFAAPILILLVGEFPLDATNWVRVSSIYFFSGVALLLVITNLSLLYLILLHGYLDLSKATFQDYLPYFVSRFTNDFLIYTLVILLLVVLQSYTIRKNKQLNLAFMRIRNSQLKNELTKSQLNSLRLQLGPHFLFNTLNTISSLVLAGDKDTSVAVTTKLGGFLRRTLDYDGHQLVTLRKELEFFDLYMEIELIRFGDRLQLKKYVDEECLDVKVPNLILQPLIENAIKFGIAKKKDAKLIELKITKIKDKLLVELFNEGPFMDESSTQGIGVGNVKTRLITLYGDGGECEIVNDEERLGVKAKILIPIR